MPKLSPTASPLLTAPFPPSEANKDIRRYALSRIKEATLTKKAFTIPDDFSPEKYIDPEFGIYEGGESFVITDDIFPKNTGIKFPVLGK